MSTKNFEKRTSQRGIAVLAMVLAGLAIIAMLFWAVNNTSSRYADNQAKLVDQVAAYAVMQDLALMARRAYDLGRATAGACPGVGTVTNLVSVDGVSYCFPRLKGSCVRHPFETAPLNEDPVLPLVCFDPAVSGTIHRAFFAGFDPSQEAAPREENRLHPTVFSGGLIDIAHAQTAPKPWFPDVSASPVYSVAPDATNIPTRFRHVCGIANPGGVPCVTISLCVRVGAVCSAAQQVRQTFAFD